jgi:hypothetical protein
MLWIRLTPLSPLVMIHIHREGGRVALTHSPGEGEEKP